MCRCFLLDCRLTYEQDARKFVEVFQAAFTRKELAQLRRLHNSETAQREKHTVFCSAKFSFFESSPFTVTHPALDRQLTP